MPTDPRDTGHLVALKICYYVSAGLGVLGCLFLIAHFMFMNSIFGALAELEVPPQPEPLESPVETGPDAEAGVLETQSNAPVERPQLNDAQAKAAMDRIMKGMKWLYLVLAVLGVAHVILNFMCARAIAERKRLVFIQVIAGISCLSLPLGTALGVCTFIVLSRPTVTQLFKRS